MTAPEAVRDESADAAETGADPAADPSLLDVVRATAAINRTLRVKDAHLGPTIQAVVDTACSFTGFDVGLILVEADQLVPQATTGHAPHELDLLQQQLGTGPCLDAARGQSVVHVADTAVETRWGPFGPRAVDLGVGSMLCVPLWVDDHLLGTLSLYARRPDAFDERDRGIALLCGTLAAAALADARRAEQLRGALARRDLIGQAKGILMAQQKITADRAFDLLRDASQRRNQKLAAVAQHVVDTGALPAVPSVPDGHDRTT